MLSQRTIDYVLRISPKGIRAAIGENMIPSNETLEYVIYVQTGVPGNSRPRELYSDVPTLPGLSVKFSILLLFTTRQIPTLLPELFKSLLGVYI